MALPSESEVTVLSTTAMKTALEELGPAFERETGHRLKLTFGPSLQLEKRLAEGEGADVAIVTHAGAQGLIEQGRGTAGSLADVARSFIGVCVAKGAPRPDLSSAEAFKEAMLRAKSIALSKPVGGGASGAHMASVFERLGIAATIKDKSIYGAGGPAGLVGLIVARGQAEIGIQQMAELMAVSGVDVVGPLPDALQSITQFTAFVPTTALVPQGGRAVIDFLRRSSAKAVIKAKGLEPN
ncbi:MAG TPA: substrate-binding domain-containing protein [Xanthobacteraceae bacterium]|nr:substrate-binding domain-containing protein [Xanthobacteraceae bacterium]